MATGTNPFPLQFSNAAFSTAGTNPIDITTGDFNSDGILDLATANNSANSVSVLLGTGTDRFTTAASVGVGSEPYALTAADFDGDGRLDLAVANRGTNTVSLLLGTGTGTFTPGVNFTVASQPISIISGDFNGDRRPDLASVSADRNNVTILLNSGTGDFSNRADFTIGTNPTAIITADFNGDGKLDLATANAVTDRSSNAATAGTNSIAISLGEGNGIFSTATSFNVEAADPYSLTAGDFNGDGKQDIATANFGANSISVLLGNGTGGFGTAAPLALGASQPYAIASRDFNGDGKLDLITTNSGSRNVSVLLGNGNGTFTPTAKLATSNLAMPIGLAIGDFNRDGKPDLASTNFAQGNAAVFLNRTTLISLDDSTKTIDASLERSASITADLNAGTLALSTTPSATTPVTSYRNVIGTALNDAIGGSPDANILDGREGNDTLNGLTGNDILAGGAGDDALNGGDGDDRYFFAADVPLGSDTLADSKGTDTLDFSATTLPIAIDLGINTAQVVNSNLTLTLPGNQLDELTGGGNSDRIRGNALDNKFLGGAGDDSLNGLAGDDDLLGDSGNDRLTGDVGDDDLVGGMGSDLLRGGVGEDDFIFDIGKTFNRAEMGVDRVRDFDRNFDRFVLDRTTFTALKRRVSFASVEGLGQARRSNALITYVRSKGSLYYNENGSERGFGNGGLFAVLDRPTLVSRNLVATDFAVRR